MFVKDFAKEKIRTFRQNCILPDIEKMTEAIAPIIVEILFWKKRLQRKAGNSSQNFSCQ